MSDRIEAEILDVLGEEVVAAVDTPLVVIEGPKGDPGVGVSPGGAAGQMLVKKSGADYDTEWRTPVDPKQIGDLADLTTEAKGTLVAAINEVARSGGAGSISVEDDGSGNVEITEVPSGWTVTDDGNGNVVIGG